MNQRPSFLFALLNGFSDARIVFFEDDALCSRVLLHVFLIGQFSDIEGNSGEDIISEESRGSQHDVSLSHIQLPMFFQDF